MLRTRSLGELTYFVRVFSWDMHLACRLRCVTGKMPIPRGNVNVSKDPIQGLDLIPLTIPLTKVTKT